MSEQLTENAEVICQRIRLSGVVQGVGFRPLVWRLAHELKLSGWVRNDAQGVEIEVCGLREAVELLLKRLHQDAPPLARIDAITSRFTDSVAVSDDFYILDSRGGRAATMIGQDTAICRNCLGEMFAPNGRRWRYAFTNCAHCGPRYTICHGLPYDRERTSMRPFVMCKKCQAEYRKPDDRRLHAEGNCCPKCGPQISLLDVHGDPIAGDVVANAYALLRAGKILAIKGPGGFHLACDAKNPDAVARQQAEASICQLQREDAEMKQLHSLPDETRDGEPFELLANCFGPEDIDTAMQSGAKGVGLLRSGYMMLPGRILDEQEQYFFYCSCLAAANGCPVTVRTFDFGSDRTVADANQGPQSSKLGLRGIRNSLRQPQQFQTQICALLRAAARGPLRVMFPMVTDVEDWDAAMSIVEHCRQSLRERGVPFNENTQFGVMLSIPAACLTVEDFVAHGCDFLVIGTNDLTQYTHAADRELASAERYYRPASPAMKKLIAMVMETAKAGNVPVTICGLAVGNPVNTVQYLQMGLRSFSVSPQNLLRTKKTLLEADAHPDDAELE